MIYFVGVVRKRLAASFFKADGRQVKEIVQVRHYVLLQKVPVIMLIWNSVDAMAYNADVS